MFFFCTTPFVFADISADMNEIHDINDAIHVPSDIPSLEEAISLATPGATIYVHGGVHPDIQVSKAVQLIGINDRAGLPRIELPSKQYGISISSSDVLIEGFVLTGSSSKGGIYVSGSDIILRSIYVTGQPVGIRAENTANVTIMNSQIQGNMIGISLYQAYRTSIYFNTITNIDGNNIAGWAAEPQLTTTPTAYRYNGQVYTGPLGNFWGEQDMHKTEQGVYLAAYELSYVKQIDTRAALTGQLFSQDIIPTDSAALVSDIIAYEILSEQEYQAYLSTNQAAQTIPSPHHDAMDIPNEIIRKEQDGSSTPHVNSSGSLFPIPKWIYTLFLLGICVLGTAFLLSKHQKNASSQYHSETIQTDIYRSPEQKKETIPTFPASYAHRYHDITFVHQDTQSLIFSGGRVQDGRVVWIVVPVQERLKSRDPTELYVWRALSSALSDDVSHNLSHYISPLLMENSFPVPFYEIPAYKAVLSDVMQRKAFSKAEIGIILLDLLKALQISHKQGILHLSLRPDAVALTDANHAVLMNFMTAQMISKQPGTPMPIKPYRYCAPEQFSPANCLNRDTDIYQFGVLWYELVTKTAFYARGESGNRDNIWEDIWEETWEDISKNTGFDEKMATLDPKVSALMYACLSSDRASRPECDVLMVKIRELYLN